MSWKWYGRAGHFICGDRCQMHLHTHVNGYCISTVGEYKVNRIDEQFEEVGCNRLYETMVFKEDKDGGVSDWTELEMKPYNDLRAAEDGHMKTCLKYARKKAR